MEEKITCPDCGLKFNSTEEHDKHHKNVHGGKDPPVLICASCGFEAEKESEMDEHAKTHTGGVAM